MRRLTLWPAIAGLLLPALAACGSAAAPAASPSAAPSQAVQASPSSAPSQPVQISPSVAPAPASPSATAAWKRSMDVKPLAEAGIFKVVSEAPSPGDKVPLFFMGAQG